MFSHVKRKHTIENSLPSQMLALEPRYLFDAAAVATVADTTSAPTTDTSTASTNTTDSNQQETTAFLQAVVEPTAVADINDQGFFIKENSAVNTFAGQIVPAPDGVTFTLIDDPGSDSDAFAVSASGEITVKDNTKLDFESDSLPTVDIEGKPVPFLTFQVQADDGSSQVTIDITMLLEDGVIDDQGFFIDENSAVNTFAGQIVPAPDGVTFTLIDGMDSDAFAVSETGEITVKDSTKLNYEDSSLPTVPIEGEESDGFITADSISDSTVVDFSTQTTVSNISGPIQIGDLIGEDITVTGDPNSGLYTNFNGWGLGSNGSWGGDMSYTSANNARPGSLLFSFNDGPVSAVGGFMNHAPGLGSDLFITAYDSGMNVLETYNISELADIVTPGGFNDGAFRGIDRGVNDISFFEVTGYVPVLDNLTFTRTAAAVTTAAAPVFDVPFLQFQVQADDGGSRVTIDITMLLNDVNDAPAADTPGDITINPGETATVQIIASDQDKFGDSNNDLQAWTNITYMLDPQPSDGPDDPKIDDNGLFTWKPTEAGTTTITVKVSNNGELEQTVQFDVTVLESNSPPTISDIEAGALPYVENDGAAAITSSITVADVDDTNIEGATVQITGNYVSGEDVLAFTNTSAITGTWNAVSGILTLTGSDTVANYQAALRAVTYENTSESPDTLTRTVSFTVDDGDADSNAPTRDIGITAVNDAPLVTAPGSALAAIEQISLSIEGTGFSVSDVDAADGVATATLAAGEGNITVVAGDSGVTIDSGNGTGTVTLSGTVTQLNNLLTGAGTGTITYLNNSDNPSASTTLTVTVNDGGNTGTDPGTTGTATTEEGSNNVTINITAFNDAPVVTAPGSALAATEQISLSIEGTGFGVSDDDAANGVATATLAAGEGNITVNAGDSGVTIDGGNGTGTVILSGTVTQLNNLLTGAGTGTITYLNNSDNPSASTTLTVTVNDGGNTGTDPGTTGTATTEEGSNNVTINITAFNDAPVVTAPGSALAATEQISLSIEGTGFGVSDDDAANGVATATLAAGEGNITVNAGDSGVTIDGGNGTGTVTLSGTVTQLNNLLTGAGTGTITYLNNSDNPSASTTLTVTVNDGGNTGTDSRYHRHCDHRGGQQQRHRDGHRHSRAGDNTDHR